MAGAHAIVLGASMAGLLAARVLADSYRAVTLVERDELPEAVGNRRGVPQGRHAHGLLGRGSLILADLFPGFEAELVTAGVPAFDYRDLSRASFLLAGHRAPTRGAFSTVPPLYFPSRPLLESLVRRRVREIPNVEFLTAHDVVDLTSTSDRVTGARVMPHNGAGERVLDADLVVDATGRGARTPALLEDLGYGRPTEDTVTVHVVYSSQLLQMPPGALREMVVATTPEPGRPTGMALFGYENDTWMFTAFGMAGREPPTDPVDRLAFVEAITPPHIMRALRDAVPLSDICRYRYPENRWRRYDKMRRFPEGLLVIGDAVANFNPIYGQGMTVAALQALALRDSLSRGPQQLARRYFRAAAKPIAVAWRFATGADLSQPEVQGHRSLPTRIANGYVQRLLTVCESDIACAEQLIRVTGLIDPPTRLLRPRIMYRVARTRPPR
ncbi:NAD(P)/FAD-dependent oxidoreductase [Mycobacterium sp. ITM-2016-00318]|uniref:FAD-dependent oxidoreductase n=1 Tax=Mycobacterium sp. ITM-2016-00318 TaxID=2099693 RepID=UPI000CFA5437|nr:FAD-dependent monooxygenase [Mycobacterium sp. ITM-2016-00318]WNG94099.1 FAD-binding protein [Mycobacterium sp. ITM-2016-00318]